MLNSHSFTTGAAPEAVPETSVIIVGRTNSGKTTAGQFLQQYSDSGVHVEASSVLADILENRNESMTPENIRRYMEETNKKGVVRKIIDNIKNNGKIKFVTGLRSPVEVEYIQNSERKTCVVGIIVPHEVRLQRAIANSETSRSTAKKRFKMKEGLDQELGITKTIKKYPEFEIQNDDSIKHFQDELRSLYDRVLADQSVLIDKSYPLR